MESATVGLVMGLADRGDVDVHVVTLETGRHNPLVERFGSVTVHRLPGSPWPMILDVFAGPGRRTVDRYIRNLQPDVVHFQETYGFGARGYHVPVVFTVHGFDSLNLKTERRFGWQLRAPLWRVAERIGIGSHRHLVSIAPYVTAELRSLSNAAIAAIPNAISADFFSNGRAEVPGRILFAGWLNPRKNLITALDALRQLLERGIDARLHAAGAAVDAAYARQVADYIEKFRLEKRVTLLGRIGRDQIRREMAQACALVLPSLQENAPMVVAEALAAGLPVVAANACGVPDMVEEAETGYLIDPLDAGMIADRLARLITDHATRQAMSAIGRERARQRWHPASVAAATVALYTRLISEHTGSVQRG